MVNDSFSFIQCKKWGCPSCTKLPADIHAMMEKWNGIHWYCITCEPIVRTLCASKHGDDKDVSFPSTDTRGKY